MSTENYFTREFDMWQEQRLGRFTASGIHALLTTSRSKDQVFGKTAETYICKKVAEIITGEKPEVNAKQLEWGCANEHDGVQEYIKRLGAGHKVEYFGIANPRYFELNDKAGGSPDGLIDQDGMLEMKCPWDSAVHVKNLLSKSAEELKANSPEYYTQNQFNMRILDRQWCDHVSYDPRVINPANRLRVIRVYRDQEHIDLILGRLELAIEEVKRILEELDNLNPVSIFPAAEVKTAEKKYTKPRQEPSMPGFFAEESAFKTQPATKRGKAVPPEMPAFLKI